MINFTYKTTIRNWKKLMGGVICKGKKEVMSSPIKMF